MHSFFFSDQSSARRRTSLAAAITAITLAVSSLFLVGTADAASHAECTTEPTRLFDKDGVSRGLFNVEVCKWTTPPGTQAETEMTTPECCTVNFMRGKQYYALLEGYTCTMNSPDKNVIGSWKLKIQVMRQFIMLWGDKCNDAPLLTNLKVEDFEFSEDGLSLTYNGDSFEYLEREPKF